MFKKSVKWFALTLLISVLLTLFVGLIPKTYDVPGVQELKGVKYWNLATGSHIAYVLLKGKGLEKAYPIIFLQGGPGGYISSSTVEMLRPLSEDGFNVYLYDQIGSGHSQRLEDIREYTAERHKRDLAEFVKKTGADKVILLGQSWGAILGVLYASENQEKIAKIIFTGPGPIVPINPELAGIPAPDSLRLSVPTYSNAMANRSSRTLRSELVRQVALWFGTKLASDLEADGFQTLLNSKLNKSTVCDTSKARPATGGGGYYVQLMTVNSFTKTQDPRPGLENNRIPVLILKGECDNQKWGFTSEYLSLFPNSKLVVIPGAGHSIAIEQPASYIASIRSFIH